jgi:hypothetical protein
MKTTKREVADILKASYPDYTGRKFNIIVRDQIWVDRIGGGGSRDEIKAVGFVDGRWIAVSPETSVLDTPCGYLTLSPEAIYAVHSFFCGNDCGITFYVSPQSSYLPKMAITK